MVVPASTTTLPVRQETAALSSSSSSQGGGGAAEVGSGGIPTVDMSTAHGGRAALSRQVARACAEHGFFRAINHGVPPGPAARLDAATAAFFALAPRDKQRAGPPSPLGYGCRSIGFNGDTGDLEYLLLHASPVAVAHRASSIDADDPSRFSNVVNEYVAAVRQLACEILDLLGEGLGLQDSGGSSSFSKLITDTDSDSLLRINHYPPSSSACSTVVHKQQLDHHHDDDDDRSCKTKITVKTNGAVSPGTAAAGGGGARIGFGEHSDPQILSLLRANDVNGLQVLLAPPDGGGSDDGNGNGGKQGVWVQVPADPSAFFVNVGDLLQALTNGRLVSVRHRVVLAAACKKPRLSTIYFAAPPPHARISAVTGTVDAAPRRYRAFTWAEYKNTMYSLRLSHSRLDLFRASATDDDDEENDDHGVGKGEQE